MTRTIQVLSDLTINQIAAGEVIENPASVVKELVENAIDSGATQIEVETLAGGFQWIKISDNGSGMCPEDAVLCLERHATSKLSNVDDLLTLHTMGFRGEALASIASISKMTLLTSQEGARATQVDSEGGKITSVAPAARARGTTLEIHSLFYNVPARKKFQKSPSASSAEITKILTQLCFAHPVVGFTLIQQSRSVFSVSTGESSDLLGQLKERAACLLSADFVPSCKEFRLNDPHCQGVGLIAEPSYARRNRSGQHFFINSRPVNCPGLSYAIKDAYGTRLSTDQHPVYLLHLSIPPALIDVNVHPQKREVRLRDENLIKYALHGAINMALGSGAPVSSASWGPAPFSAFELEELPALVLREEVSDKPQVPLLFPTLLHIIGLYKTFAIVAAESLPLLFFGEKKEGLVFFDLQAVERRIQFDSLLKRAEHTPVSQGLLFPHPFSCSLADAEVLSTKLSLLKQTGLCVEQAGKTTFLINAIPPFLEESSIEEVLTELLSSSRESPPSFKEVALLLSLKAGRTKKNYSLQEARPLIEALLNSSDPHYCSRGKPTKYYFKDLQPGMSL